MLYQIFSLLLEICTGFFSGLCLLRMYMQQQRIPMSARSGNPMGPFIFAMTDWLVLPLRRVVPALGRLDTSSLLAAFLSQLALEGARWLMLGGGAGLAAVPVLAFFGLGRMCISAMTGVVLVYAVLSWVQTQSYLSELMERLVSPALAPIRRVVPLVGGVDLSPLVLLVLLQIAAIVLGSLQAAVLGMIPLA